MNALKPLQQQFADLVIAEQGVRAFRVGHVHFQHPSSERNFPLVVRS